MGILKNKSVVDLFLLLGLIVWMGTMIILVKQDNRGDEIASQIVAGQTISMEDYVFYNKNGVKDAIDKKVVEIKNEKEEQEREKEGYQQYLDSLRSK